MRLRDRIHTPNVWRANDYSSVALVLHAKCATGLAEVGLMLLSDALLSRLAALLKPTAAAIEGSWRDLEYKQVRGQ